jgi:hypothetical protein
VIDGALTFKAAFWTERACVCVRCALPLPGKEKVRLPVDGLAYVTLTHALNCEVLPFVSVAVALTV